MKINFENLTENLKEDINNEKCRDHEKRKAV